jgi:uridine kinase
MIIIKFSFVKKLDIDLLEQEMHKKQQQKKAKTPAYYL